MARRMSMGSGSGTSFGPLVLLSIFTVVSAMGAWLVLLGGASYIQHKADTIAPLLNQETGVLTYMDLPPQTTPRKLISYEWFKAILQILTLIFCLISLATGQLYRTRLAMVGLLAVNAMLWIQSSQTFYYVRAQVDAAEAVTGSSIAKAVRCYWAGCMMSAGFDLALIILLGLGMEPARTAPTTTYNTAANGKGMPGYTDENMGGNTAV